MAVKTLKPVLKTVRVGSVKLTASADCIGSGKVAGIDNYPVYFLSPEHVCVFHVPEPEPWSRQEVADMSSLLPRAEAPRSSTGTPSGIRACRRSFPVGFAISRSTGTQRTIPSTASAQPAAYPTESGRLRCLGSPGSFATIDRDCQSPDLRHDFPRGIPSRLWHWLSQTPTRTVATQPATTAAK